MTDLGTLGGGFSFAYAMNDVGQVVGPAQTASGDVHTYLWDSSHGMQGIGAFTADAINNYGQVAGSSYTASGSVHAIVWDSGHGMQDLGTLPGAIRSDGFLINDTGLVAGTSGRSQAEGHAFVWDSIHGMQDLGTFLGPQSPIALESTPSAINNSGQVAGRAQSVNWQVAADNTYVPVLGPYHAFVWDRLFGMQDLGALGGYQDGILTSYSTAINNSGQVAGDAQTLAWQAGTSVPVPGPYHAFVWDGIQMQDLGTLGGNSSHAIAMNNNGQVIGNSDTASGYSHAFLWDSIHGMQDLGTLGGTVSTAYAINDSGQVWGLSDTSSGTSHVFVWDSSHGMQDIGNIHGTPNNWNHSGQVSGTTTSGRPANSGLHAFFATLGPATPEFSALSAPTIVYGTATTLSGNLANESSTPPAGETVSVTFNGVTQNAILDGAGNFSTTISPGGLHVGSTFDVVYSYAGDSTFGAASGRSTLSVQPAPLTIAADNQTKVYGAAMPTPTASYNGFVNGDTAASLTTSPSLTTTATATSLVGTYSITPSGACDPNYDITYVNGTLTIIQGSTSTTVTSSLSSFTPGHPVTFTATVSANAPGLATPTGTVEFVDSTSNAYLGTVSLSGGIASLSTTSLPEDLAAPVDPPQHNIIASYFGDSNFLGSDNSATPLPIAEVDVPPTVAITNALPTNATNTPTAPVGTLLTFGASLDDSLAECVFSWSVTQGGQPYSLPASTETNGPSFSFSPNAVGNYVVSLSVTDPDGGNANVQQTVDITSMDAVSLQNVVNTEAYWINEGTLYENGDFNGGNPQPAVVVLQADPTQINAAQTALNAIGQPTIYDQWFDAFAVPVTVALNLTNNSYNDLNVNLQPGITLIINGVNGTTVVGHSPALTITSGNVAVNNVTLTTATNAPTILVTGGNLALRNDVVQESTGYADAAISVTGGAVDLGSPASPGNNTININGSGQLVQGSGPGLVSAAGDTFQTNGTAISPLTTTTLTSSANSAFFNQSVTLTANVAALTANTGTPTGSVSFFDQASGTTLASVALSGGVAKWTSSSLTPGGHTILAVYSGASKFITSSSSLVENVSSFSGFLAPLSNNLAFNMNRVIPIKWQLGDSSGKVVTGVSAVVSLQVAPILSGGVLGTPFNPAASNGIGLRNDGKQYTFNWDTKDVAVGTYQIQLTLADGTVQTKTLQIVTKGGYAALVIDGAGGAATTGGLLAGDINLYVDNSNGDLTADELARIQDAVTAVDAVTEPFGVAVTEVADPTQADVTLNMDTTSTVGGYADGVLGCTTDAGQITLIAGWNFYAGSDATQIGPGQYDFQTVVTHELGHALGLGHSANGASVMYATLNSGTVNRMVTTADLNVADNGTTGACGLHAAMIPISAAIVPALDSPNNPARVRDAFFALLGDPQSAQAEVPASPFANVVKDILFANPTEDSGGLPGPELTALCAAPIFTPESTNGADGPLGIASICQDSLGEGSGAQHAWPTCLDQPTVTSGR
jgi:probable HAF family extracellular repeat protein